MANLANGNLANGKFSKRPTQQIANHGEFSKWQIQQKMANLANGKFSKWQTQQMANPGEFTFFSKWQISTFAKLLQNS